ncbi:MAG: DUF502 domain-containing protein [Alicyclobacillaceae bacterium]|jgi:uncharacterized membrane protein|uniref:DUF502 domain-containing protein n=1 Tax=Alicyclobacillus sp. SP_1 TaxID=2942475 RepID=UPI00215703E2|nr:DUF502 domain-containing protein [Alicyclobacillus sp. SP_1]MCY0888847.1 DUF502 domain-containing protein [Alicyclobacillaceae bacterium]MCY0897096.1 DUF502 domain-containing protein [Alicyclobacillaceae bacterium]
MIFKKLAQYFGVGFMTVLPFALVIWLVVFVFNQVDSLFGDSVNVIGGVYIPGIGVALVVVGITVIGAMTRLYISRQLLVFIDKMFGKIPLIKSVYSMTKEIVENLLGQRRGFRRVVLVEWPPGAGTRALGFVTSEQLPIPMDPTQTRLAVYIPNAFQFAGPTLIVDRDLVVPCDMSVEQALQFVVSGGLGRSEKPPEQSRPPRVKRRNTPSGGTGDTSLGSAAASDAPSTSVGPESVEAISFSATED